MVISISSHWRERDSLTLQQTLRFLNTSIFCDRNMLYCVQLYIKSLSSALLRRKNKLKHKGHGIITHDRDKFSFKNLFCLKTMCIKAHIRENDFIFCIVVYGYLYYGAVPGTYTHTIPLIKYIIQMKFLLA